jgi:cell division protein FtsL
MMSETFADLALKALQYGLFGLLGVLIATFANKRKSMAEIQKLEEETEKLNIENQNLRAEQMNAVIKENTDLQKARDEIKGKLYIANEEKLMLSKELAAQRIESAEYQKILAENQKKFELLAVQLNSQGKDIGEIKKKTGQLPKRDDL